jgi:predicted secreted protein
MAQEYVPSEASCETGVTDPKVRAPRLLRRIAKLFVLLIIVCSQTNCGGRHKFETGQIAMAMQVFDESSNGREFKLAQGQTFQIRLEENPTSGHRWELVAGAAPTCTLISDSYDAPAGHVPGRPGLHSWTFRTHQAGKATIQLVMRRSWESGAAPAKAYRITLTAED